MRSDSPTVTFNSNTTGITFFGIVFFLALIMAIICLASDSASGPVSVILCVFVGGPFSILLKNYRQIAMYEDHMEVRALL